MNREIKFKAWDKKKKKMCDILNFDFFCNSGCTDTSPSWVKVERHLNDEDGNYCRTEEWEGSGDDFEIMQYIGLKDKNGKEIYEGDIMYVAGVGNCVVKFNYGAFGLTREDIHNVWEYFNEDFEGDIDMKVLGNIYENPKLLEALE